MSPGTHACSPPDGPLDTCRDPVAEWQGFLSNIFMALMPSARARAKMHLSGISQPLLPEKTVWYFWREDFPGAFALELGEADLLAPEGHGRAGARARFWVKYYPALQADPVFDDLSVAEQSLRLGPLFDGTGTPSLEGWESLPEAAFHVGYLEMAALDDGRLLRLELSAQDRWRVRRREPLDVPGPSGVVRLVEAGALDRNMPGWPLAWAVFDTVVTAIGLFHATAPLGALLREGPGELGWATAQEVETVADAAGTQCRQVLFLPCLEPDRREGQPVLWDAFGLLQPALEACEAAGNVPKWLLIQPPESPLPWLNPYWWQVSTEQDLEDAGLCCLIGHDLPVETP